MLEFGFVFLFWLWGGLGKGRKFGQWMKMELDWKVTNHR
jgi:hypothetical protein